MDTNTLTVTYKLNEKEVTYEKTFTGTPDMKDINIIAWKAGQLFGFVKKDTSTAIKETVVA